MRNLLIIAFIFLLTSCVTYQRCKDKFATTLTDSVTVTNTVSLTIPKDSIVTRWQNDTVTFVREIQQGRAKVIVEKTKYYTVVKADCDSATKTVTKIVKVKSDTNSFGVAPFWKYASLVLAGIAIVLFLVIRQKK